MNLCAIISTMSYNKSKNNPETPPRSENPKTPSRAKNPELQPRTEIAGRPPPSYRKAVETKPRLNIRQAD